MMDALEEMARECFGYGRWEAPYWFIGLEEGMSGTLEARVKAWQNLGTQGLCDCRRFHHEIKVYKHHSDAPALESTWRVLMLILLNYLGRGSSEKELKSYQSNQLGTKNGETALLELFGLPAKNIEEGLKQKGQHFSGDLLQNIHHQRLLKIHERIREHAPQLVIMYGTSRKEDFGKLAGRTMERWDTIRRGPTLMSLIPHPASRPGVTNERWVQHAKALREWQKQA